MNNSMIAYDPQNYDEIDYGLLFDQNGTILLDPYYRNVDDDESNNILNHFFDGDGGVHSIVSNTIEDFIKSKSFTFDSDIIKLYYGIIARGAVLCSVEEMWR